MSGSLSSESAARLLGDCFWGCLRWSGRLNGSWGSFRRGALLPMDAGRLYVWYVVFCFDRLRRCYLLAPLRWELGLWEIPHQHQIAWMEVYGGGSLPRVSNPSAAVLHGEVEFLHQKGVPGELRTSVFYPVQPLQCFTVRFKNERFVFQECPIRLQAHIAASTSCSLQWYFSFRFSELRAGARYNLIVRRSDWPSTAPLPFLSRYRPFLIRIPTRGPGDWVVKVRTFLNLMSWTRPRHPGSTGTFFDLIVA